MAQRGNSVPLGLSFNILNGLSGIDNIFLPDRIYYLQRKQNFIPTKISFNDESLVNYSKCILPYVFIVQIISDYFRLFLLVLQCIGYMYRCVSVLLVFICNTSGTYYPLAYREPVSNIIKFTIFDTLRE